MSRRSVVPAGAVMRAGTALVVGATLAAGCAVGPAYRPALPVPEATRVGGGEHAGARADSTRAFFDSLAMARAADTAAAVPARPAPQPPRSLAAAALADLSWLDILRDTALTRLVEQALRQNRDVALAQARIDEYRALMGAARAPLLPSVSVNGSASKNQIALGAIPPVAYTAYRLTGDLAWELDFWGKNRRGLQAATADEAAQEAAARGAVLSLVSDVAGGYLQLLELDQEHAVAEQTLASRRATLALARERFARGVISELDVRQFEAQVAVPAARLAQVEQLRSQQEHALDVLLGEGPAPIPRGVSLAAAARGVTVPDSIPAALLARRPDVEQAERAYAAASARIGVADAARLPTVSITGSYGSQTATPGALFGAGGTVYTLLAGVSVPIFTGGRLSDQARAARARADEARAAYERTVLAALGEAGDALAGVRSARDVAAAEETQAVALRRALELAELRYGSGVSGYLEVLDAERGLFEAELAASQA
ncbi:MAG: efflux transporter outer membrane subunit, partial [Gemmatimonadales bacterium]